MMRHMTYSETGAAKGGKLAGYTALFLGTHHTKTDKITALMELVIFYFFWWGGRLQMTL